MKVCNVCGAEWPDTTRFCPSDGSTLKSASGDGDLIGSVIAAYHIEKKLGEGGMGAVYLGEHVKMGRKSAIKVMSKSLAADHDAIARFSREATNAAQINHPNVCAIYDFGETEDGTVFLAMEFIEGQSLNELLAETGALPLPRAVEILVQVGKALQAAHDLGIVHRDLKPDNIMLAQAREGHDVVKVVDFGIAKAMGGEKGQQVTRTGLVVGTPEYMSPEQLSGDNLDGRSDTYSLGLVFYRMLTGYLPFQADNSQEIMIKRLTDDPLPLAEVAPHVPFPPQLQVTLDRALQRMPGDRYATALEFVKDVEAAVGGERPAAPVAATEAATQFVSADAKTRPLAATRISQAHTLTPETPIPQREAAPPKKGKPPMVAIAASVAIVAAVGGTAVVMMKSGGDVQTAAGPETGPAVTLVDAAESEPVQTARPPATGDRTGPQTGSGDSPATGQPASDPGQGQPRVTTPPDAGPSGGEPEGPSLDPAAVNAELGRLADAIETPASRQAALRQLRGYYENPDLQSDLRAQAASILAIANFDDDAEACRWYRRASDLDPANTTYANMLSTLGCAP